MGIGTLEIHPIDLTSAYGALADGGKLMPRTTIVKVVDTNGAVIWPDPAVKPPKGAQVVSPQTAYIVTDILKGNTEPKTNPSGPTRRADSSTSRPPPEPKSNT